MSVSYGSHGPQYNNPPYNNPWAPQPQGQPFPPPGDPGTLDLPYYGIGFVGAIKRAFQKYARFDGRASRSEYWWYALFNFGVVMVLYVLGIVLGLATGSNVTSDGGNLGPAFWPFAVLIVIFVLVSIVPGISITMRRLHDQDLSGWLVLLSLVPNVGSLVLMILALLPSKPSGARYDQFRSAGASRPAGNQPPWQG